MALHSSVKSLLTIWSFVLLYLWLIAWLLSCRLVDWAISRSNTRRGCLWLQLEPRQHVLGRRRSSSASAPGISSEAARPGNESCFLAIHVAQWPNFWLFMYFYTKVHDSMRKAGMILFFSATCDCLQRVAIRPALHCSILRGMIFLLVLLFDATRRTEVGTLFLLDSLGKSKKKKCLYYRTQSARGRRVHIMTCTVALVQNSNYLVTSFFWRLFQNDSYLWHNGSLGKKNYFQLSFQVIQSCDSYLWHWR